MKQVIPSLLIMVLIWLEKPEAFAAENSRSDTIDILDFSIHLDITDYAGKTIGGFTVVTFKSKINNINQLDLDLLELEIDSITQNNQQLAFTYNDTLIKISLLTTLNAGDSSQVTVYYHGVPQGDALGWGGFYFSGDYAFNLGVGFAADPHVYGRAWFPCFDNFVERSTYHFSIITTSDKKALCNGELISTVDNGNGTITSYWEMLHEIPSYLACVAVNKYAPAHGSYISITGDTIPIQYGAVAADTTKMKNSFVHLPDALVAFEEAWGPYRWNKVGYSLTTVGAMEHATNIGYPYYIVNGTTANENVMAHELSHHWFGDLITCRTQEDMWLNEGWAVYCEKIFFEEVYGKEKYQEEIAAHHEQAVHYAHTSLHDGDYFAMNAVPHEATYGTTVYIKGNDMAHTLRGYMGDSLFFHCVSGFLEEYAFKDVSSEDLRDYLSDCSGINLGDYFNNWIFTPGWAAFTIDSVNAVSAGNNFSVNVFIRQRLNHTPDYYTNVPLEISFYDQNWNVTTQKCMMSGRCGIYSTILPFQPLYTGLDMDEKISDAVTADTKVIFSPGSANYIHGEMTLDVNAVNDSALLRIEHVYAAPDPFKTPVTNLHISRERFWKVDGIIPFDFDASSVITYNGTTQSGGFLDNQLISNSEDSLVVLFREEPFDDWEIVSDVTIDFQGSHTDKKGKFTINYLQAGEYTLGIFDPDKEDSVMNAGNEPCQLLSAPLLSSQGSHELKIFPNPSNETVTIQWNHSSPLLLEIFNLYGDRMYHENLDGQIKMLSVKNWNKGIYLVKLFDSQKRTANSGLLVIQ